SERAQRFWDDDRYAAMRAQLIERRRNQSAVTRELHRQAMTRRYSDPAERLRHSEIMVRAWAGDDGRRSRQADVARQINLRSEITAQVVRAALDQTGSIRGAADLLECDRSVFRRFPEVLAQFRGSPSYRNHRVVAVRELPGEHDTYCLTVPEAGN